MTGPALRGGRCQCAACGEYFASERAFDRHRIGDHAPVGRWQGTRRCMSLPEMLTLGWQRSERGFLLTPDRRRAGGSVDDASATPAPVVAPTGAP